MRCVLCNGKTKEKNVEYKEFGISLGHFRGEVCEKCGEVYFDEKIVDLIQNKSKEMGLFGLAKRVKVAEIGNSLAIRIPKNIAKLLDLKKGKEVIVIPKDEHDLHIEV